MFGALNIALGTQIDDEWQIEIIRDPAVIRAYVHGRQLIEEEATLANSLAPTGDADKDKRAKKRRVVTILSICICY
jgi:transcription initiation factor TFIID subunit 1